MPKVKLGVVSNDELKSRRFDAWTHYQHVFSRQLEGSEKVTAEDVAKAKATLDAIDAEMNRRRRA